VKAIDLFCGAGGLTYGLRQAGLNVTMGVDIESTVSETYERNNPEVRFVPADLRTVTPDNIRGWAGAIPAQELILAGCAPCQPFSKQRQRGLDNHVDVDLLMVFARLVKALRPGVVLMENVPGVASTPGSVPFRWFLQTLRGCGYECDHGVLNARDFGVPQHRRRYVLMATLDALPSLPKPGGHLERGSITVRDAIEHFPPIDAGETHRTIPNHHAAGLSSMNLRRIKATPVDGGSRRDWPKSLELNCHRYSESSFTDVYGRMWWDRAAPTLTSRCNSLSNGRFGHPEQDRAISLREAATLQTFPEDYEFFGPKNQTARWIGNAVPVLFAKALGKAVLSTVN